MQSEKTKKKKSELDYEHEMNDGKLFASEREREKAYHIDMLDIFLCSMTFKSKQKLTRSHTPFGIYLRIMH